MCGIAGYTNLDQTRVCKKILGDMTDSLAHRGPDGRGLFIDRFIGLGHRRLAIIDLSSRAAQPMSTSDQRFTITFNGEIYNYLDLKRDLIKLGDTFGSDSDTEVALKFIARYGCNKIGLLNGMFAMAVWDRADQVLTLVRDRFGIKPLYYWHQGNTFLFASEIKALMKHPDFLVRMDHEALAEYFTFQNNFSQRSFFKGVKLLSPGEVLQIHCGNEWQIVRSKYWDFHFEEEQSIRSPGEYREELDRLVRRAVHRQLVSDVEVGSYLSGGIDSSSIVALASENTQSMKTFCIGFNQSSASGRELLFDEREKAGWLSGRCQTDHHEMVLQAADMIRCLPALVWSLEDLRLGQSYPNYYASQLASNSVKVCLSGAGGDELFAGYPWRYYRLLKSENYDDFVKDYYQYWQRLMPGTTMQKLLSPIRDEVRHINTEDIFREVLKGHKSIPSSSEDYINHSLYFEAKTFLHGLLMVEDKLSMSHGLEVRLPFLDNDLVDFALKVPIRLKLKDIDHVLDSDNSDPLRHENPSQQMRDGKIILRQVMDKYLGSQLVNQPKQGFCGPDASWFRRDSFEYIHRLLMNRKAQIYQYLDFNTVNSILLEHMGGIGNRRLIIWSLLCFEWWLKLFVDHKKVESLATDFAWLPKAYNPPAMAHGGWL